MTITKLIAHLIIMVVCLQDCKAQQGLSTEAAKLPLGSGCEKKPGTYFDSSTLSCESCPANTRPNADGTGCECASGWKRVPSAATKAQVAALSEAERAALPADFFLADFLPTCERCPAGTAPSQDGAVCLACGGGGSVGVKIVEG